jgi:hypothetical protein
MNLFFEKVVNKQVNILDIESIHVGNNYKIKYYDQYKYSHFLEGKCVKKRKILNTYFILLQSKSKGLFFSFFYDSPLIISLEKLSS